MLPKFLLADNTQEAPDSIFVVHTENPRCIIESDVEDFYENQIIHWIDDDPQNEDFIAQLLEDAEAFIDEELSYDFDEEDEE